MLTRGWPSGRSLHVDFEQMGFSAVEARIVAQQLVNVYRAKHYNVVRTVHDEILLEVVPDKKAPKPWERFRGAWGDKKGR